MTDSEEVQKKAYGKIYWYKSIEKLEYMSSQGPMFDFIRALIKKIEMLSVTLFRGKFNILSILGGGVGGTAYLAQHNNGHSL